jgi:alkylation response protein AidB-like acyl-CoA dehydrogenase
VLAAAMLTGITEAVRDLSAQHAINRVQFGKPIGVNQAVKHPCAQMAVYAELAYAQTVFAAVAHDEGRADADFHAVAAIVAASKAATWSTAATIQVFGAMGFTYEHDAHLFLKRAAVVAHVFDGLDRQLDRLLSLAAAD